MKSLWERLGIEGELKLDIKRIAWRSLFWVPYFLIPLFQGFFDASHIPCESCWDDHLRHALSMFGYGFIGCFFYALTGKTRSTSVVQSRFLAATGWNLALFLMGLLLV